MIKVKDFNIETKLVPSPADYSVLLPENYDDSDKSYPLTFVLHGGGGYMGFLRNQIRPIIRKMWKKKLLPEMVLVTPHCNRSFYMDYRDGSQKWETFLITELLPHLRKQFRIASGPNNTFLSGISMGGMGTLRLGLKYLDIFKVLISFEAGIEAAFEWKDVKKEDKFYRSKSLMQKIFGKPIDEEYWKINNPSYIARENAEKIRESGVKIYIEVGTEDMFGLFRGSEFFHRILFDNNIPHEFRYVYGADHLGASLKERFINGYSFLNRMITNPHPDGKRGANMLKRSVQRLSKKQ